MPFVFLAFHSCTSTNDNNIIIITVAVILLCSMSISHKFVLKNYKDSWNDGPPWSECKYCIQDELSDESLKHYDRQSDLNGLPSVQNTDLLSPWAPEFHPSVFERYNRFGDHRLFRSLPSRRHRGYSTPRRRIRLSSYREALPWRSTNHHCTPTRVTDSSNFTLDFRSDPKGRYQDSEGLDHHLQDCFQVWNSLPTKSPTKQKRSQESVYHEIEHQYASNQDTNSQAQQPICQSQLSSPGASVLRATSTEFVSQLQQTTQPSNSVL